MSPRKIGQHHGDLRSALLESTLALLEQGESSPSLRQIARHAGVSSGAPYHHFGDRAGLLCVVATQGFEQLATAQREALDSTDDALERLEAITRAYVLFCFSHRAHYRTMFDPMLSENAALGASARECFALLVSTIAAVRPELDERALTRCARQSWALSHGAVLLGFDALIEKLQGPVDPEGIAAEVSDAVLKLARSA